MTDLDAALPTIGWIGTGVMGGSMADRLLDRGYPMVVYNRTRSKCDPMVQRRAILATDPADVACRSDVVISIVGMPEDVREIYLGPAGVLSASENDIRCRTLIDMTTSRPDLAVEIHAAAAARAIDAIDAPVSGGDVGARGGTLSIMVGGEADAIADVRPILEVLGRTIVHQGAAGSGQHTKMVNQILIAGTMMGMCEAIAYAERCGLNCDAVMQSVSGGAAGSWSLDNLAPRILQNDFEPGFFIEHFVKDLRIALDQADQMNLAMPTLALAKQFYAAAMAGGWSRRGTQALQLVYRKLHDTA